MRLCVFLRILYIYENWFRSTFILLPSKTKTTMEKESFTFDPTNFEQQKAFNLVANTNTSLFITGKAGTGKTTFVMGIQEQIKKSFLVLAPTGIAAMNVGGQTIHSFFGLPFEAIGPETKMEVSLEKRKTLEHIDTIIIDEASMVRCDWVDGIDRFLRALMHTHLPFGGKQVVFVGDLFQLPPVVRRGSADDMMLCYMYGNGTPYFYKANVMKRLNLPKIEFQKVYRQEDSEFLDILDRMRLGENTENDLAILNRHVSSDDKVGDYSVILTARVITAEGINDEKLKEIDSEEFCYEGEISGKFKSQDVPAPITLKLKVGAQVMFCRNDKPRGVVNGTIAKVVALEDDSIKVALKDGEEIEVEKMTWESKESVYDETTKTVESEVVGSFTQYPLKLAWAITIHKSQGMTFDRMHFDLTRGTFAAGQAYVVISRMRSLDGLTLSRKIFKNDILQNAEIKAFANSFNDVAMIDDELSFGEEYYRYLAKKDYDNAAKMCLLHSMEKMKSGDYRSSALLAKKMFDVMLDDKCLKGMTKDIPLLKDCSMTCHFLNAVVCLYGDRLEEAIGYANMVLDRRPCLEAMFIKGKALLALSRYDEAMEMAQLIRIAGKESVDKVAIDKKQYLFEVVLNERLGNSNIDTCKQLLKLCPEYLPAYVMLRKEAVLEGLSLDVLEGEDENALVSAFNNETVSDDDFKKMLYEADKTSVTFKLFALRARKIKMEEN